MASFERMSINVQRLILLVHNRPVLWDPTSEEYHNRVLRDEAWAKVLEELYPEITGMPPQRQTEILKNVKTRWRSVRDRFKKSALEQEQSGSSPKKRKCSYYNDLQFLLNTRDLRMTEGNIAAPQHEEDTQEQSSATEDALLTSCEDVQHDSADPSASVPQPGIGSSATGMSQTGENKNCAGATNRRKTGQKWEAEKSEATISAQSST
ncbi:uncharacterized protein LOC143788823 [Ranitomeya variabilis]|uniref:uncharacterized protein LOC143788823 n=1 Tax=Ranitomeya variabilis TaxID=490064 RepID=UPI00405756A0